MSDFFEYQFRPIGIGGLGSVHCTYCPKQPGESCPLSCVRVYETIQAERAADGVIIIDAPEK